MHGYNVNITPSDLVPGVTGIMRVKNDAQFIEICVESCIDALDELVIVWNECTDNSAEVIEKVRKKYPDKIKAYEYPYKVYSINLTLDEYEFIKSQPDNSPHLLCNYYNFALSHVTRQYAMKIDADQIYFTEKLKRWCDVYRGTPRKKTLSIRFGYVLWLYRELLSRYNRKKERIHPLLPHIKTKFLWKSYMDYVAYKSRNNGNPVSMSGLNVIKNKDWYVTLGRKGEDVNVLPPYNGIDDHLIFKMTENVYYRRDDNKHYNLLRGDSYSYIEWFMHDGGRHLYIGPCWFHINAMRENIYPKLLEMMKEYPNAFCSIDSFLKMDYVSQLLKRMDDNMLTFYVKNSFHFVHQCTSFEIQKYVPLLNKIHL